MEKNGLNSEITDLIVRSLRQELTPEEEQVLRDWLKEEAVNRHKYGEYVKKYFHFKWAQEEQIIKKEQAQDRIFTVLRRKRVVRWYYGVAASVFLVCTLVLGLLKYSDRAVENVSVASSFIPDQTQPRLILSNGEVIELDATQEVITAEDGSMIRVKDGAGIRYDSLSIASVKDVVWHKVVVPRGGAYRIRLSDGSDVWLNSETEIRYPASFTGGVREVYLKGEAYFKVNKDTSRRFLVHSGTYQLKVYGTEFNLNTYDVENIEAVLVKGVVGFQANVTAREEKLKVNQLGVANSKTGVSEIRDVDVSSYIAWKNDELVFVDESLESIMKKVSRWYDVDIIFEDDASKHVRFNGNIEKYSELKKLLSVMEKVAHVEFKIENKIIRVSRK